MLRKAQKTIEKHNMLQKGDKIIAALSGGADSVALLDVLCQLKDRYSLEIYAVHVHHGIRGDEADADCDFCIKLCKKMGVELFIKQYDIPELAKELGMSEEEAGRHARYEAFDEMCVLLGADKIAVAHNMNDDAETVIMRLCRGTGMKGLCGISPVRDNIIRPLINVSREEIEGYLEERNIPFRTDSTNNEDDYTRNRIRHNILPVLESEVNKGSVINIAKTAEMLAEEDDFIESYANECYEKCLLSQGEEKIEMDAEKFSSLHSAVRKRVARIAFEKLAGRMKDVTQMHIDSIIDIFLGETGRKFNLPYGIIAEKSYNIAMLKKMSEDGRSFFYVLGENEVFVKEFGIYVSVSHKKAENADEYRCFDAEKAGREFFARSRRDGDRLCINKDGRSKKVKDILMDLKVPREDRDKIPVIGTEEGILWVYPCRFCSVRSADKSCKNKVYINIRRVQK